MYKVINILVFAKDEEAAMNAAHRVMDEKIATETSVAGIKEYMDFSEGNPKKLNRKGHRRQIPPVLQVSTGRYPTDDKRGIKMVNDAMENARKEFVRSMIPLRHHIENYTNDQLFNQIRGSGEKEIDGIIFYDNPNFFREYCRIAGTSLQGRRAYLYDFSGHEVEGPVTLQEFLNGQVPFRISLKDSVDHDINWNQPLWVVPFYVEF